MDVCQILWMCVLYHKHRKISKSEQEQERFSTLVPPPVYNASIILISILMTEEGNTQDLLGSQMLNLPHSVEEEDSLLFQTDYHLLKKALMNEKASPEILPYQHDLLSRVYIRIDQQVRVRESFYILVLLLPLVVVLDGIVLLFCRSVLCHRMGLEYHRWTTMHSSWTEGYHRNWFEP